MEPLEPIGELGARPFHLFQPLPQGVLLFASADEPDLELQDCGGFGFERRPTRAEIGFQAAPALVADLASRGRFADRSLGCSHLFDEPGQLPLELLVLRPRASQRRDRTIDVLFDPFGILLDRDALDGERAGRLLESRQVLLGGRELAGFRIPLRVEIGCFGGQARDVLTQPTDLPPLREQPLFRRRRAAAADRPVGMHHLALARHQSAPVTISPPELDAPIEVVDEHRVTEQAVGEVAVAFLHSHRLEEPGIAVARRSGWRIAGMRLPRPHRDEIAAPGARLLELVHGVTGVFRRAHDDVLQAVGEDGRNRLLELRGSVDDLRDEPEHAVTPRRVTLHDRAHPLVIPAVSPLDLLRRRQPRLRFGESRGGGDRGLFELHLLDPSSGDRRNEPRELFTRVHDTALDRRPLHPELLELRAEAGVLRFQLAELDLQRLSAPTPIRGALLGRAQAISHLGFAALALDVLGLRLVDLEREECDSPFRLGVCGLAACETVLPFAVIGDELGQDAAALVDLGRELRDALRGMLAIALEPRPLIPGLDLLAIEHLQARLGAATRGASLEQRLLSSAQLGLRPGQPAPRRLPLALARVDRRGELGLELAERAAPGVDLCELGIEPVELAARELQLDGAELLLKQPILLCPLRQSAIEDDVPVDPCKMSPTRVRLSRVRSIFRSAARRRSRYSVVPAASSMNNRTSSGSRIHQLIDTPLLDHGVGLGADAGAEQIARSRPSSGKAGC